MRLRGRVRCGALDGDAAEKRSREQRDREQALFDFQQALQRDREELNTRISGRIATLQQEIEEINAKPTSGKKKKTDADFTTVTENLQQIKPSVLITTRRSPFYDVYDNGPNTGRFLFSRARVREAIWEKRTSP